MRMTLLRTNTLAKSMRASSQGSHNWKQSSVRRRLMTSGQACRRMMLTIRRKPVLILLMRKHNLQHSWRQSRLKRVKGFQAKLLETINHLWRKKKKRRVKILLLMPLWKLSAWWKRNRQSHKSQTKWLLPGRLIKSIVRQQRKTKRSRSLSTKSVLEGNVMPSIN